MTESLLAQTPGKPRHMTSVEQRFEPAIGYPFDMLLDRRQHVGEHRGAARPGDRKEIWEAGDAEPEIGLRAFAPLVLERLAAGAADVDLQQCAGHRIKAGGEDDRIDRIILTLHLDAGWRDRPNRVIADINQRDIWPVIGLPVAGIDAEPLAAEDVSWRKQPSDLGVVHNLSDLAADKLGRQVIGCLVIEQIT